MFSLINGLNFSETGGFLKLGIFIKTNSKVDTNVAEADFYVNISNKKWFSISHIINKDKILKIAIKIEQI